MGINSVKFKLSRIIGKLSPRFMCSLSYYHNRGRWPDFDNPSDISEIILKRIIDGEPSKHYLLADKYAVRQFIEEKGYGDTLTPLLGVYSKAEDIDFDKLPSRFALKMNYGAGMNIICTDINKLDVKSTQEKLNYWLALPYNSYTEPHYNLIERKIIAEAFIDDGRGGFPSDYKFMCVDGEVFCILACYGRETGEPIYGPFDLDWKYLPQYDRRDHSNGREVCIDKPDNLNEMLEIAKNLSRGLDVVRIDLYSSGSKIWFGEITLTPAGGILHGWTQKALDDMGVFYKNQKRNT